MKKFSKEIWYSIPLSELEAWCKEVREFADQNDVKDPSINYTVDFGYYDSVDGVTLEYEFFKPRKRTK